MSGSVNNLIALQAGQGVTPVENPLAQQAQYMQARQAMLQSQNAMNQNRLFQSQQKQGQLAQQAIDPSTGQFSPSKFNMLLGQSPGAGIGAQDAIAAAQTQSSAQQTQAQGSQKQLASGIGGLLQLNNGAGPTYGQTTDFLQRGLASGAIQPQSAKSALIGMPSGDDPQSMATRTHMIQTIQQQMASSQEQLTNAYGTPTSVSNGQTVQPGLAGGMLSGNRGAFNPAGAPIQQVTGPETNAAMSTQYVPDPQHQGQYIQVPVPRSALPGASGVAGPQPSASPGLGTGRPQAPAGTPSPATGGGAPAMAGSAPPAPFLAAQPPGVAVSQQADTTQFKTDQAALPAAQTTTQNMQHALTALQLSSSGRTPQAMVGMGNLLQSAGLLPAGMTNDLANYELFHKLTERLAMNAAGSSNTDAGRALSQASNAGTSLSTPANIAVLQNDIGKQRQAIAQNLTAPDQQTGIGYGGYAGKFSNSTDPRGFQWDMLQPAQKQQILSGMKPGSAPWNNLHRSIGMATKLGLFDNGGSVPLGAPGGN